MIKHPYEGHLLEAAFSGFVNFASKDDRMIDAFLIDHPECVPPRTVIERLIDEKAGKDKEIFQTFVDWCVEQFGPPDEL